MADSVLDTRGLLCPLPILKAKKAIQNVPVGGTLEVWATDPGATDDFTAFCRATGHTLIEQGDAGGALRFVVRRES
jgi:tRNA 2-thiouridine synthesizing protein A